MKLLLFSPDSYSVFHPGSGYIFGGAEIETGYHAKGLAKKGIEVTVITRDHAVPVHTIDDVQLVPSSELKGAGYWKKRNTLAGRISYRLKGDRSDYNSDEDLINALDPDAVYIMGMSPEALKLARFSKLKNKKFIFRVAHDLDLFGEEKNEEKIRKWGGISSEEVKEVIAAADVLLVQTQVQEKLLEKWFGRKGILMFPPLDLSVVREKNDKKYDVFWIGKNNVFKRPEKLAELARDLPEKKFCMVLNKMEAATWQKIVNDLPGNVELIESVPADQIEKIFAASRIFVSTSLHEGFANTYLQAAKYSVPVVSMGPDPNEMLSTHGAGFVAGDNTEKLKAAVSELLENNALWQRCSAAARAYVEKFHDKEKICDQFFSILTDSSAGLNKSSA